MGGTRADRAVDLYRLIDQLRQLCACRLERIADDGVELTGEACVNLAQLAQHLCADRRIGNQRPREFHRLLQTDRPRVCNGGRFVIRLNAIERGEAFAAQLQVGWIACHRRRRSLPGSQSSMLIAGFGLGAGCGNSVGARWRGKTTR